jgi:hypothetical protein
MAVLAGSLAVVVHGQSCNGVSCTWQEYRPVIGGVRTTILLEISPNNTALINHATLGYVVRDNRTGRLGVITVAHVSDQPVGKRMYQPNFTWDGTYYIGNITIANETADLAYIQFISGLSGDPALLYIAQDSWQRPVKIYVNTTVRWESLFKSLTMYKTGQTTGTTKGYLNRTELYCMGVVYCIYTDIPIQGGDSGSPVYYYGVGRDGRPWVGLVGHITRGIIVGDQMYAVATSVNAAYENGFTPLTVG